MGRLRLNQTPMNCNKDLSLVLISAQWIYNNVWELTLLIKIEATMRAGLQTGKFPLLVFLGRKSLMWEEKDQLFVLMERSSRKRQQLRDASVLRRIGNVMLGLKDRGMGLVSLVMGRKSTTRLLRVVQQKAHMCIH